MLALQNYDVKTYSIFPRIHYTNTLPEGDPLKSTLVKGTLILSVAGFITRILGFLYKLLLSQYLGAELLGIYQLIFPIYGLCFTLYASGLQTSISRLVASASASNPEKRKTILKKGMLLSVALSLLCSVLLYYCAKPIACLFIREPRCTASLRLLCFVFPSCAISACMNGYYYGIKNPKPPAVAQCIEQISRILFSLIFIFFHSGYLPPFSCEIAVLAIAVGEFTAMIYNLTTLISHKNETKSKQKKTSEHYITKELFSYAVPLTATHLTISFLRSAEAILIPNILRMSGMTTKEALSVYGILTGMTMAILLFPSTIINSLSVLLLPSISQAQAQKQQIKIRNTIRQTVTYVLLLGFFSAFVFLLFGKVLGILFFNNYLAGVYLQNLSWLCPLLYLDATLTSILNGLGKTKITFRNTGIGLIIRILLLFFTVRNYGIAGYFISVLLSQLLMCILDFISLYKETPFSICTKKCVLLPIFLLCVLFIITIRGYSVCSQYFNTFLSVCICCSMCALLYLLGLKKLDIL